MADLPLAALRALAVLLLGGSSLVILVLISFARRGSLRAWLTQHHAAVALDLAYLRSPITARNVLAGQVLALAVCAACLVARWFLPASLAFVLVLFVRPYLLTRRARRTTELEAQIDGWMLTLASALRASPALGDAIEQTVGLTASPLREELTRLTRERELGTPLDEGLLRLGARVGSRTLQSALAAVRIARNAGGELSVTLERAAATLREMARLEGVLRTKTAEAKAQAWVLGAVPFFVIALLDQMNPAFLQPLLATTRGHVVLGIALALWAASIALSRSILDVDL